MVLVSPKPWGASKPGLTPLPHTCPVPAHPLLIAPEASSPHPEPAWWSDQICGAIVLPVCSIPWVTGGSSPAAHPRTAPPSPGQEQADKLYMHQLTCASLWLPLSPHSKATSAFRPSSAFVSWGRPCTPGTCPRPPGRVELGCARPGSPALGRPVLYLSASDFGLFLSDEDPKKGIWLEAGKALDYYMLRNGVSAWALPPPHSMQRGRGSASPPTPALGCPCPLLAPAPHPSPSSLVMVPRGESGGGHTGWGRGPVLSQATVVCLQDTMEYKKKQRPLKIRMLDGTVKTVMVDDSKTVTDMLMTICARIGEGMMGWAGRAGQYPAVGARDGTGGSDAPRPHRHH